MSPCPAATNGRPPNSSGFHNGQCPRRCHHSAPHTRKAWPAAYWVLQGEASHLPCSIGSESSVTHKLNSPVATSVGRLGSYTHVLLASPGEKQNGERCGRLT